MPGLFVVLLNWNNFKDTLECLQSLQHSDHPDHRLIIVDNGSSDGSCERIRDWAERQSEAVTLVEYSRDEAQAGGLEERERLLRDLPPQRGIVMIRAGENLGFAAGNNVALHYALARGAKYVMLLNNDTVVAPDALARLTGFLDSHPDFDGATPQIRYFSRPEIVWNCGGDLLWYGARRYHHADAHISRLPQKGHRQITFLTNCASIYRAELLRCAGLLSTSFFFGEEDFEFSLRLRSRGHRIACCYDAVIYHKVSGAVGQGIDMTYLYYLDRFVDMRLHWPAPLWQAWRMAYLPKIAWITWRVHRPSAPTLARFLASLYRESGRRHEVDRLAYDTVRRHGYIPRLPE